MKLSKLGEDVTETLEIVPRSWKVIQTVREKFTCRQCEAITQPPAPFHVTPRGFMIPRVRADRSRRRCAGHMPGDPTEDVTDETLRCLPVVLDELHAIIGQHRVDPIRNGSDQSLEEARGHQLRRFSINPCKDQLRSPVHRNEEIGIPALIMQFGDIDME